MEPSVPSASPSAPWADVLASLEDGVVVVNGAGRINDLNPAAEQLLGVSAIQAVGMPIEELVRMSPWLGEAVRGTLEAGGDGDDDGSDAGSSGDGDDV